MKIKIKVPKKTKKVIIKKLKTKPKKYKLKKWQTLT